MSNLLHFFALHSYCPFINFNLDTFFLELCYRVAFPLQNESEKGENIPRSCDPKGRSNSYCHWIVSGHRFSFLRCSPWRSLGCSPFSVSFSHLIMILESYPLPCLFVLLLHIFSYPVLLVLFLLPCSSRTFSPFIPQVLASWASDTTQPGEFLGNH